MVYQTIYITMTMNNAKEFVVHFPHFPVKMVVGSNLVHD